jgi:hypothetical protein
MILLKCVETSINAEATRKFRSSKVVRGFVAEEEIKAFESGALEGSS